MGTVYEAHDHILEEVVAVKVLRPEIASSPELARRFRSEIRLARRVRHPNVCAIHEYGQDGELRYISMELIEGTDLKNLVHARGRLEPTEAFDVCLQVAAGLQAIHSIGVIHRDLKTANIMRDARGIVRLMDFGIAKQFGPEATAGSTATGHILGTPEYMSPEQARGEPLDPRTDIYALGIVIFEIFTGEVPFHGDTPVATLFKQIQDPPPLHDHRVPRELAIVLQKALSKDAADRYTTVGELIEDLVRARDEVLGIAPMAASRPGNAHSRSAGDTLTGSTEVTGDSREGSGWTRPMPGTGRRGRVRGPLAWTLVALASSAVLLGGFLLLRGPAALPRSASSLEPNRPAPQGEAEGGAVTAGAATVRLPTAETRLPAPPARVAMAPVPAPLTSAPAPRAPALSRRASPPAAGAGTAASELVTRSAPTPAAATGLLQIVVHPWAEIAVDEQHVGATPFRPLALAPGPHVVRFTHPEFKPFVRKVTVKAGETTRLEIDLSEEAFRK